ncbi:hypothetical protein NLU13_8103 [Sarocladium strictum]|uniref:DNA/RNA-binding domain-containing protein n=1 Tax=Sarocladium strictum TaxID=5046 RepID=A0AA39GBN6_SARSR|nr:hypothetical protein NLU13_8103 [Sarocladium strictum]
MSPESTKMDLHTACVDPDPMGGELQPRPISQEQMAHQVRTIYSGLVMVENKCIEVDNLQTPVSEKLRKLTQEEWQALLALHRTLLHEHHDFFLASQHPPASVALERLAAKYSMPARMWRHGIHSFLELLRYRLPESHEYMLTFIYLAYTMMALLQETVPAFEDTWIGYLSDFDGYRMTIEDEYVLNREIWTEASWSHYEEASQMSPTMDCECPHTHILTHQTRPRQDRNPDPELDSTAFDYSYLHSIAYSWPKSCRKVLMCSRDADVTSQERLLERRIDKPWEQYLNHLQHIHK